MAAGVHATMLPRLEPAVALQISPVNPEIETPARGRGYGDQMTLRLLEGGSYFLVTDDCYRFLVNKIAPCAGQSADRHGIVGLNE